VLGGMFVALLAAGGYIYSTHRPPAAPSTTVAMQPAPTAPPPTAAATPTPPPPTAAPPPTFQETKGKGAAAMKAAKAAFDRFDYDRALASAQAALGEDPGNSDAKRMAQNALDGQKAEARLRAAGAALRQGDFTTAASEAAAARALAPWDTQATDMVGRIRDAQAQADRDRVAKAQADQQQKQQQLAAQVNAYINQATNALGNKQYDVAIKLYDEALKLDSGNSTATQGKMGAITARALSEAASTGPARPAGRSFVAGRTQTSSPEGRAGAVPDGFEDSAGVTVKKGTQAAELPGKLSFEVSPQAVKAGERYAVNIVLMNEGNAPIEIRSMTITTTINGRKFQAPVAPTTTNVAPKQKATLFTVAGEIWKEDTSTWQMEAAVTTLRGETYRNNVSWK